MHVRNILKKLNATNRTHAAFVANRLLGQDAEPVALSNSLRPIDQAQSLGTPQAVGAALSRAKQVPAVVCVNGDEG